MRSIKFRAWDKEIEKMYPVHSLDTVNELASYWDQEKRYSTQGYDMPVILMQYTGTKDIEGTEIYDGDKLFAVGNHGNDLEYVGDVEWDEEDARWEVANFYGRFEYVPDGCYVRGNIHEIMEVVS